MKFYAYHLPQFYATPENDKYWEKGFTEWTNVKNAKALFKGHQQPIKPLNNDYYNLNDIEEIKKQCAISEEVGIDGFCYWHYWFGNNFQTLEKIPELHLKEKSISQRFFFAWANTDWTKSWVGKNNVTIFKQEYSEDSLIKHIEYLLPFFKDSRYVKHNEKVLLQVNHTTDLESRNYMLKFDKVLSEKYNIKIHWLFPIHNKYKELENLSHSYYGYIKYGFLSHRVKHKILKRLQHKNILNKPIKVSASVFLDIFKQNIKKVLKQNVSYAPYVLSGWDNTPRYGNKGYVIDGKKSTLLKKQLDYLSPHFENENIEFIFIKAWNEWAEGNTLEAYEYNGEIDYPAQVLKDFID